MKMQPQGQTKETTTRTEKSRGQIAFTIKTLLFLLDQKPLTKDEIIAKTGLSIGAALNWVNTLHADYPRNVLYIVNWIRKGDRGCWQAVYGLGPGMADEPKPKALTEKEYERRRKNKAIKVNRIVTVKDGVIQHVSERRISERRKD